MNKRSKTVGNSSSMTSERKPEMDYFKPSWWPQCQPSLVIRHTPHTHTHIHSHKRPYTLLQVTQTSIYVYVTTTHFSLHRHDSHTHHTVTRYIKTVTLDHGHRLARHDPSLYSYIRHSSTDTSFVTLSHSKSKLENFKKFFTDLKSVNSNELSILNKP